MESQTPLFLSPLDNMAPVIYTAILLFFPTPRENLPRVVDALFAGFDKLLHAMPILTHSITAPVNGPQTGALAVTLPRRAAAQLWRVKDLQGEEKLSFLRLREDGFPVTRFTVWDFTILPFWFDVEPPAMHAQVTLIDGGLALAVCIHHSLSDGTGFNVIVRALATCCRGEDIDPQDVARMWTRPSILSEGHEKMQGADFDGITTHTRTPMWNKRPPTSGPALYLMRKVQGYLEPVFRLAAIALMNNQALNVTTRMIHFPQSGLVKLKETVLDTGKSLERQDRLSRVDVLTALMFCCVTQSRLEVKRASLIRTSTNQKASIGTSLLNLVTWLLSLLFLRPRTSPSNLSKVTANLKTAVNMRRTCEPPVPPDYIGNLIFICNVETPVLELLPTFENICSLAHRSRVQRQEIGSEDIRRAVASIRSAPDVSKLGVSAGEFRELSMMVTSWREQDHCFLDWGRGVGVKCEIVRTCVFFSDGLSIIFPEVETAGQEDGGLDVGLSLEKGVMMELERNQFFNRFAQWR